MSKFGVFLCRSILGKECKRALEKLNHAKDEDWTRNLQSRLSFWRVGLGASNKAFHCQLYKAQVQAY